MTHFRMGERLQRTTVGGIQHAQLLPTRPFATTTSQPQPAPSHEQRERSAENIHSGLSFEQIPIQRSSVQRTAAQVDQPVPCENNRTGLPDRLKAGIEQLSGFSLDTVRIHYNSSQPANVGALAYTQGTEIHIGPGQEAHLAHEAWHVVQQKQGRVQPTLQARGVAINDDDQLEQEAETMGARANNVAANASNASAQTAIPANGTGQSSTHLPIQRYVYEDRIGGKLLKKEEAIKALMQKTKLKRDAAEQAVSLYATSRSKSITIADLAAQSGQQRPVVDESTYTNYLKDLKEELKNIITEVNKALHNASSKQSDEVKRIAVSWIKMNDEELLKKCLDALEQYIDSWNLSLMKSNNITDKTPVAETVGRPDAFPGKAAASDGPLGTTEMNPNNLTPGGKVNKFNRTWTLIHELTHAVLGTNDATRVDYSKLDKTFKEFNYEIQTKALEFTKGLGESFKTLYNDGNTAVWNKTAEQWAGFMLSAYQYINDAKDDPSAAPPPQD